MESTWLVSLNSPSSNYIKHGNSNISNLGDLQKFILTLGFLQSVNFSTCLRCYNIIRVLCIGKVKRICHLCWFGPCFRVTLIEFIHPKINLVCTTVSLLLLKDRRRFSNIGIGPLRNLFFVYIYLIKSLVKTFFFLNLQPILRI